jgi:hypothetical protein
MESALREVLSNPSVFLSKGRFSCCLHRRKKARDSSSMLLFSHSSPSLSLLSCACSDPRSATHSAPSAAPCRNTSPLVRAKKPSQVFDWAFIIDQLWQCGQHPSFFCIGLCQDQEQTRRIGIQFLHFFGGQLANRINLIDKFVIIAHHEINWVLRV